MVSKEGDLHFWKVFWRREKKFLRMKSLESKKERKGNHRLKSPVAQLEPPSSHALEGEPQEILKRDLSKGGGSS